MSPDLRKIEVIAKPTAMRLRCTSDLGSGVILSLADKAFKVDVVRPPTHITWVYTTSSNKGRPQGSCLATLLFDHSSFSTLPNCQRYLILSEDSSLYKARSQFANKAPLSGIIWVILTSSRWFMAEEGINKWLLQEYHFVFSPTMSNSNNIWKKESLQCIQRAIL